MKNFLILMSALVLSSCSMFSKDTGEVISKPLTAVDSNREVVLPQNHIFRIVLPSNPTTGYTWNVVVDNPNVVSVYNTYHDKGLNIISVSLDRAAAKDKWLAAIENDKMDWFHVSNLMEWQDPVARKYGVTAIPATYLIDAEGVIIDKNLRGEALVAKMQELLGEG